MLVEGDCPSRIGTGAWPVGPVAQTLKKLSEKSVALNSSQTTKIGEGEYTEKIIEARQAREDKDLQVIKMGTRSANHSRARDAAHGTCIV